MFTTSYLSEQPAEFKLQSHLGVMNSRSCGSAGAQFGARAGDRVEKFEKKRTGLWKYRTTLGEIFLFQLNGLSGNPDLNTDSSDVAKTASRKAGSGKEDCHCPTCMLLPVE